MQPSSAACVCRLSPLSLASSLPDWASTKHFSTLLQAACLTSDPSLAATSGTQPQTCSIALLSGTPGCRSRLVSRRGLGPKNGRGLSASANTTDEVDAVVVGAGVIGLAIARSLALNGLEVVIVDAAKKIGSETSSRNSEVIHAGIYYPFGHAKARLCVEGRDALYAYCKEKGVPHKQLGKLVVATHSRQLDALRILQQKALSAGVASISMLSQQEALSLEPNISCVAALLSPVSGIIDSAAYMESLLADAQAAGATLALNTRLLGGVLASSKSDTHVLELQGLDPDAVVSSRGSSCPAGPVTEDEAQTSSHSGDSAVNPAAKEPKYRLRAKMVVNSAGLWAQRVAGSIAGIPQSSIPHLYLTKGTYFNLPGPSPFSRLVYPVPEQYLGGLGMHLTLDMAGQARFGPDTEWVAGVDYRVDPARADNFYPAVRSYWPGLKDGCLQPGYCGVRAKLAGPGQPSADFFIQALHAPSRTVGGPRSSTADAASSAPVAPSRRGWVNLFGMESPGLTASLAIAGVVTELLIK